jgi:ABC-type nitrate/sulfonate/bicarbonate transport system substrate-binding protein
VLVVFSVLIAALAVTASRLGWIERARERIYGPAPRLAAGDFPAGVMAPIDDVVKIPTRAIVVGLVPHGSDAPLLWAAGDSERVGLFRAGYAIDVRVARFEREDDLRRALISGAENGGVDLAVMPVSSVAMSASLLRNASPRVIMLVGRSRGQEVLVGKGLSRVQDLSGKRIGVEDRSGPWYLMLWALSRAGLSLRDVQLVPLDSAFSAGAALREGKVDAVAGLVGDVEPVARELGAQTLATTADAPHLMATVLVARGDFAARYPDAIKRFLRGALDANAQVLKDRTDAARVLGTLAPQLGDPMQAISLAPPATLKENLAFFGIQDEAPVTWTELFGSAASLNQKLFNAPPAPAAEDTADLGALKYVASAP